MSMWSWDSMCVWYKYMWIHDSTVEGIWRNFFLCKLCNPINHHSQVTVDTDVNYSIPMCQYMMENYVSEFLVNLIVIRRWPCHFLDPKNHNQSEFHVDVTILNSWSMMWPWYLDTVHAVSCNAMGLLYGHSHPTPPSDPWHSLPLTTSPQYRLWYCLSLEPCYYCTSNNVAAIQRGTLVWFDGHRNCPNYSLGLATISQ